jgi:NADP-dependent 3-hydroxy acid dehydrogenase YdfG
MTTTAGTLAWVSMTVAVTGATGGIGQAVVEHVSAARHAVPRWSAYTASKSALRDLADSLREEEDRHGVRVTTIYPGGVGTDLLRRVREQFGQAYDPAAAVSPRTIAMVVLTALEFPDDAHLMDITLRGAPSGGSR